jgi:hypothetical protein
MTIHLGTHDHPMAKGRSRDVFEEVKSMVEEEALHTLGVTMLAIALVTSKIFLLKHLLNKDGQGSMEVLKVTSCAK